MLGSTLRSRACAMVLSSSPWLSLACNAGIDDTPRDATALASANDDDDDDDLDDEDLDLDDEDDDDDGDDDDLELRTEPAAPAHGPAADVDLYPCTARGPGDPPTSCRVRLRVR